MKNRTDRGLVRAAIIGALILPLINTALFRGLGLFFLTEPLTYPALIADSLAFAYEFFRGALAFLPPICIGAAIVTRSSIGAVSAVSVFSVPLISAVMALEDVVINDGAVSTAVVKNAALDWLFVLVGYVAVVIAVSIAAKLSKRADRSLELFSLKGTLSRGVILSVLVTAVIAAVQQALETYVLVMTYGAPENASQVTELATPYIILVIGAFLAYITGCIMLKRRGDSHKSREDRK